MNKITEPKFTQPTHDRLELKKGGGCIGLFGTPFFFAGLFILLMSMQIIPVSNARELPWWSWILMSFMGIIFTGVGASLMFGRSWITINKTKHRIWKAWGLLRPMRGEQYDLGNYQKVILRLVPGDSDSADSYNVLLKSENSNNELDIYNSVNYGTSYEQATLLANFLDFRLEDNTTDHPVTISPGNDNSGQTIVFQEKAPDISAQPEFMKCEITESEEGLQIRVPGPDFRTYHLIGLIFPVVILLVVAFPMLSFFNNTNTPMFVQFFFVGFIGLFFILLPLIETIRAFRRSRSFATTVIVNPQGISISENAARGKKSIRISAADIIGIDYGTRESVISAAMNNLDPHQEKDVKAGGLSTPYVPVPRWISWLRKLARSKGIIIKSKQSFYSFGGGLPDEEVYHIYTLVRHYLNQAKNNSNSI